MAAELKEETLDELMELVLEEAQEAKNLLRQAGFGVTGLGLLGTVKECLEEIEALRNDRLEIRDYES